MGRIKSSLIKRTAKGLLKEENKFNQDFSNNKVLLGGSMPSKSLRNKIAGYITRIKRNAEKQKQVSKEKDSEQEEQEY
jgi:ribosomal protein S17E